MKETQKRLSSFLFLLHRAHLLEQLLQTFRAPAGFNLKRPVVKFLQLLAQLDDGLLAIGHQLLQILISKLLPGATLTSTLPAAFKLSFHVDFLDGNFATGLASTLTAFLTLLYGN